MRDLLKCLAIQLQNSILRSGREKWEGKRISDLSSLLGTPAISWHGSPLPGCAGNVHCCDMLPRKGNNDC